VADGSTVFALARKALPAKKITESACFNLNSSKDRGQEEPIRWNASNSKRILRENLGFRIRSKEIKLPVLK